MYKFKERYDGECRVYYRLPNVGLFCIQNDGSWGTDKMVFYRCSKDGEPSHEVPMPPPEQFNRLEFPKGATI